MTTIREALLAEGSQLRVICNDTDNWLVGKDDGQTFAVFKRPAYARGTTTIIVTTDEATAVAALLGEEEVLP